MICVCAGGLSSRTAVFSADGENRVPTACVTAHQNGLKFAWLTEKLCWRDHPPQLQKQMGDETEFFPLLSWVGMPVHVAFLSLRFDPLSLLSPSSTPAPQAGKSRYHQLVAGWSSACKAPDETESCSIL